jgi:catechol 2,3-dioxygenase-like lactoylglutathione lyase family enzyme
MSIPPRISLATLGTADLARMREFYVAIGWPLAIDIPGDFCVFRTAGAILALYPRPLLLEEAGGGAVVSDGFRHFALAINLESPQAVDDAIADALAAGGSVLHAARHMDWGGYSGYFADPEGNAWEVAYNPGWPLDAQGLPTIPAEP